jgi:transposase
VTNEQKQRTRKMRKLDMSITSIARELGVSANEVRAALATSIPAKGAEPSRRPTQPRPMDHRVAGLDLARARLRVGPGGIRTWQDKLRIQGVLPPRRRGGGLGL